MVLVLIGGVLSAVGAFVATMRQNQEKAQSATQRAQFEKGLREKSDEIAELNKQIAAQVTGGDSYCTLFVSAPGKDSNQSGIILISHGQYPVYDVSVKIPISLATKRAKFNGKRPQAHTPPALT